MQKGKSSFKIQNLGLLAIIFIFLFLIFTGSKANAAELFFEARSREFTQGDEFLMNIFLNTEGESVNAAEGKIFFPSQFLEVKEIRDENSIVNFWIERPSVSRQTDAKQERETEANIVFSGIIPGGYQETKGFLFSVVFQAKANGSGTIEIHDAKVLLNDGKGTPTKITISSFQFNIKDVGRPYISDVRHPEIEDKEPPETFRPEIARHETLFDRQWFLVFTTQDKSSGISHYEVKESRQRILGMFRKWISTESPYVLKDQKLRSYIYVKAVDKAGNERIAVVEPRYPIKWYEQPLVWGIIILGVTILYIFRKILWKKLRNIRKI